MATLLAILSVLSAAASFGGLILQYFGTDDRYKRIIGLIFILAIAFSAYMLLVPGTEPVERVESKLRYVKREVDKDTMIQESTFSIIGSNVYAIQFPEPYRDPPNVSVINIHGYCDSDVPRVGKITNHFFEVRRWGSCGAPFVPQFLQEYKWIAEGRPYQ